MIDWLRKDMAKPAIELGGTVLPIELIRHKRAKRLILRLAPDGSAVRITLPHWCRSQDAIAFANVRREWLEAQLAKVPKPCDPADVGKFAYRGNEVEIDWREQAPRRPRLEDGKVLIGGARQSLTRRLQRWLEGEALSHFSADAETYCAMAELEYAGVRLSRAKRRWGSCSSEGMLRLNWRLIQAPDWVRRSVVAHEVTHLMHFDHSPAFHALLDRIYEGEVDAANAWLSQNGRSLYAAFG